MHTYDNNDSILPLELFLFLSERNDNVNKGNIIRVSMNRNDKIRCFEWQWKVYNLYLLDEHIE